MATLPGGQTRAPRMVSPITAALTRGGLLLAGLLLGYVGAVAACGAPSGRTPSPEPSSTPTPIPQGPVVGSWSTGAPAPTPLSYHSATLLRDGRVLVITNYGGHGTAYVYDLEANTWGATGPMVEDRIAPTATLLADGRVLVVRGAEGAARASAEIYDPNTEVWSRTTPMREIRSVHSAVRLADGRVLVMGGLVDSRDTRGRASAELFDPVSATWSSAGLAGPMSGYDVALLLRDGRVFLGWSMDWWLYDPLAERWEKNDRSSIVRLNDKEGLIRGILNGSSGALLYQADTYCIERNCYVQEALRPLVELPDGRFLDRWSLQASGRVYDPRAGTWHPAGNPPPGNCNRLGFTVTALQDGRVLVLGGERYSEGTPFWKDPCPPADYSQVVQIYDVGTRDR